MSRAEERVVRREEEAEMFAHAKQLRRLPPPRTNPKHFRQVRARWRRGRNGIMEREWLNTRFDRMRACLPVGIPLSLPTHPPPCSWEGDERNGADIHQPFYRYARTSLPRLVHEPTHSARPLLNAQTPRKVFCPSHDAVGESGAEGDEALACYGAPVS